MLIKNYMKQSKNIAEHIGKILTKFTCLTSVLMLKFY